jgi:hypothetical protein
MKEANKAYREANKEKLKEYEKAYQEVKKKWKSIRGLTEKPIKKK